MPQPQASRTSPPDVARTPITPSSIADVTSAATLRQTPGEHLGPCSPPDPRGTSPSSSLELPGVVVDDDPRSTLPLLPTWADSPSDAGAAAAVKHFMALLDYAYRTGDLEPFAAMSHKSCEYCKLKVADVETLRDSGSYTTGLLPEWLYEDRATKVGSAGSRWRVTVRANTAVVTEVDRDGVVAHVDEPPLHEIRASHGTKDWTLREVEVTNTEVLDREGGEE